jgi:hypothetical protein
MPKEEKRDDDDSLDIVTKPRRDLQYERVSCVFCYSTMNFLPGMPVGHSQWMCSNCGSMAYEGYGDTPARDTKYDTLSISNDPYPVDDPYSRPAIKDIELGTEVDEPDTAHLGRIEHTIGGRKLRRPMRFYFQQHQNALEATMEI